MYMQVGIGKSCGVNRCPYVERAAGAQSSPSTWHALIFVLLCNAVSVVLTALLPSLLSADVHRHTPSAAALSVLHPARQPVSHCMGNVIN